MSKNDFENFHFFEIRKRSMRTRVGFIRLFSTLGLSSLLFSEKLSIRYCSHSLWLACYRGWTRCESSINIWKAVFPKFTYLSLGGTLDTRSTMRSGDSRTPTFLWATNRWFSEKLLFICLWNFRSVFIHDSRQATKSSNSIWLTVFQKIEGCTTPVLRKSL